MYLILVYTGWDEHVYKDLLELAGSSAAGSKLVTFADAILTVSKLLAYRWIKQWQTSIFQVANPLFGNIRTKEQFKNDLRQPSLSQKLLVLMKKACISMFILAVLEFYSK